MNEQNSTINSTVKPPVPDSPKRYLKGSYPYELSLALIMATNKRANVYTRYMDNREYVELLIQKHAYYFDLLLNKDGKKITEVLSVFEWSQEHSFWKPNIKSSYKFREKYSKIMKHMEENGVCSSLSDEYPEYTEKFIQVFRALISNPEYQPSMKERNKFIEGVVKAVKFFHSKNISPDCWDKYLLRCLVKNYTDQGLTIFPGNFNSDHTWGILMSQYVAEIGL